MTRPAGVDVATKGEIFQLMRDLAAKGYAILFYSSDMPELVHVADRVLVMRSGRVAATLTAIASRRRTFWAPLCSRASCMTASVVQRQIEGPSYQAGMDWRSRLLDRAPFLVACLMLFVIVAIYGRTRLAFSRSTS